MEEEKTFQEEQRPQGEVRRSAEDRALDQFADLLIEKLQTIQSDWKKPWFTQGVSTSLPKNLSGREYNGMNSLMLIMHAEKNGYELPVWCTFDRVVGLNYGKDKQGAKEELKDQQGNPLPRVTVNKGEKSFPVFISVYTVVHPETKEKISYDEWKKLSEEDRAKWNRYPKMQVYNVFNVDQTNLKEARPALYQKLVEQNTQQKPELKEGEQFSFPAIDHMIEHNEWICPIKPTYGDDAYYSISKAEIVIPEKKQFKSGESFYANLAHEMAHSTGAESFLNRLKPSTFGSAEYAREELCAELTAALTSQRYGMSKVIKDDSIPYLKNWLDSLKEEPSYIKSVLQDVKRASHMINQHIDQVQMKLEGRKSQGHDECHVTNHAATTYDIPKWSLNYIMNGESDGISEEEKNMVDKFLDQHFPDGFVPEIEEGKDKELNRFPAFGTRNENALASRGEPAYQAVDTISVKFNPAVYFEVKANDGNDISTHVVADNTKEVCVAKGKNISLQTSEFNLPAEVKDDNVAEEKQYHYHR